MIDKIINYLRWKLNSDYGSDVLVTSVILIPLIAIAAGFALDMTKNSYMANAYDDMASAAVQTASNERNIYGELTQSSATVFVNEYKRQRGDTDSHIQGEIQTFETASFRPDRCSTQSAENIDGISGSGEISFPYIRFNYNQDRGGNFGATTFISTNGSSPDMAGYNPEGNYVMGARVYDVGSNYLLGMIGQNCQIFSSEVSSTAVLEDQDWSE